ASRGRAALKQTTVRRLAQASVDADPDAFLVEALLDQELEGRPRAAACVEHAVDLPLGHERVVLAARVRPVGELGQPFELARELDPLLDRALQAFLADRDVETGLAQRFGQRAERVPVEGLRRHRAAARVQVLRRRDAPELLPELAQQPDQLLARREPAWHEPGFAFGGVPAAEMLDHRLWVHGRLAGCGELAHRRRAAESRRPGAQLLEDL